MLKVQRNISSENLKDVFDVTEYQSPFRNTLGLDSGKINSVRCDIETASFVSLGVWNSFYSNFAECLSLGVLKSLIKY